MAFCFRKETEAERYSQIIFSDIGLGISVFTQPSKPSGLSSTGRLSFLCQGTPYDVTFAPGNNGLQCHALTILMSDGEPSPFTPPSDFLVAGGTGIGFAVGQRFAIPNGTTIRCRMNLVSASGDPDDPFMVVYVQWWIGGERVLNYFPRPENATHPGERLRQLLLEHLAALQYATSDHPSLPRRSWVRSSDGFR